MSFSVALLAAGGTAAASHVKAIFAATSGPAIHASNSQTGTGDTAQQAGPHSIQQKDGGTIQAGGPGSIQQKNKGTIQQGGPGSIQSGSGGLNINASGGSGGQGGLGGAGGKAVIKQPKARYVGWSWAVLT